MSLSTCGWKARTYREGQTEIPIIIPRNYLNLYNFGFCTEPQPAAALGGRDGDDDAGRAAERKGTGRSA